MLNAKALGMAGGILWGLGVLLLTFLWMGMPDYAMERQGFLTGIYPGYEVSVTGAIIGLVYGFIDAFVGLLIFGWLYNKVSTCCCLCSGGSCTPKKKK